MLGRCYMMYYRWASLNSPARATDDFFKLLDKGEIIIIDAPSNFGKNNDTDILNLNKGNVTFKYKNKIYGGHINWDVINRQKVEVSVKYRCPLCGETIYADTIKEAQEHIKTCEYHLTEFPVEECYWKKEEL